MTTAGAQAQTDTTPSFFSTFWRRADCVVARRTLSSHLRSGWLWGEVAIVVILYAAVFDYIGDKADPGYFYGFAGRSLGGLAILGTAIMAHRAFHERAYLPLARLTSRAAYLRGVALAAAVLRIALFCLLLALFLWNHHLSPDGIGAMLSGGIGLLMTNLVLVALTLLLSPPIAVRWNQIVFLAWLVLAIFSYSYYGPLASLLAIIHLPLLPIAVSSDLGTTGITGLSGLSALLCEAAYCVVLLWTAQWLLMKRDLLLH
jgi:hypothetical protein